VRHGQSAIRATVVRTLVLTAAFAAAPPSQDKYVERIPNRNSPPAILLRESYRDGDKIKKRTLANLSARRAPTAGGRAKIPRNRSCCVPIRCQHHPAFADLQKCVKFGD